jgi:hypothetical protein
MRIVTIQQSFLSAQKNADFPVRKPAEYPFPSIGRDRIAEGALRLMGVILGGTDKKYNCNNRNQDAFYCSF